MQVKVKSSKVQTVNGTEVPLKACTFCGSLTTAGDPCDPERGCIRWVLDDESTVGKNWKGTNCYYCERTWYRTLHARAKSRGGARLQARFAHIST